MHWKQVFAGIERWGSMGASRLISEGKVWLNVNLREPRNWAKEDETSLRLNEWKPSYRGSDRITRYYPGRGPKSWGQRLRKVNPTYRAPHLFRGSLRALKRGKDNTGWFLEEVGGKTGSEEGREGEPHRTSMGRGVKCFRGGGAVQKEIKNAMERMEWYHKDARQTDRRGKKKLD